MSWCISLASALPCTHVSVHPQVRAGEPLELMLVSRPRLLTLLDKYPEFRQRLQHIEVQRRREDDFIIRWGNAAKSTKGEEGATASSLAEAAKNAAEARCTRAGGSCGTATMPLNSWMGLKLVADNISAEARQTGGWAHTISHASTPASSEDAGRMSQISPRKVPAAAAVAAAVTVPAAVPATAPAPVPVTTPTEAPAFAEVAVPSPWFEHAVQSLNSFRSNKPLMELPGTTTPTAAPSEPREEQLAPVVAPVQAPANAATGRESSSVLDA